MRFGIVHRDLPIIGRIDKEACPRVLGYLFFLFGVLSVFFGWLRNSECERNS
ncbi:Uncharacterised protein [Serratia quinivorans]|nr:Uncharacterised protein [Serratia quinivorans]